MMNSMFNNELDICGGNKPCFKQTIIWSSLQLPTKIFPETTTVGMCGVGCDVNVVLNSLCVKFPSDGLASGKFSDRPYHDLRRCDSPARHIYE